MPPTPLTVVHGHRGCAGPFPANTLPAFLHAASIGCHWLEMDVVVTGDGHVLVSHEPWMDPESCRDPEGRPLTAEAGRALNIFTMPLAEVQRFRCIATDAPDAGGSATAVIPKPTLAEVVGAVKAAARARGSTWVPGFNIEIKSDPRHYGTFQPPPARFAELVLAELAALHITGHCLVQSFDTEVLEILHVREPALPLALLTENAEGAEANLGRLTFTPAYYGPAHRHIDDALPGRLRAQRIGLLAWTVNEEAEMRRLIRLGVDGLITDHPAAALALLADPQ